MFATVLSVGIGIALTLAPASAAPRTDIGAEASPDPFFDLTHEMFRALPQANEKLDPAALDPRLLSAAIFHETNRRRQDEGLPWVAHDEKVLDTAAMQAGIMAERGSISHVNPELPEKRTLVDRLRIAALQPAFAAENVALAFGLAYQANESVYAREENGSKIFTRKPGGEAIEMHTYLSFAGALLDQWMGSPLHRRNVLAAQATFAGTSCQSKTNEIGMPVFYCAQVFFTPVSQPAAAK